MRKNPFYTIRRRLRLTQRAITGLSISSVQRIEMGHYEALSEGMLNALVAEVEDAGVDFAEIAEELEAEYGTPYLAEAYQKWRVEHRQLSGARLTWPVLDDLPWGQSPIGAFARLTSGSVAAFCKDFCIQVPTLTRYAEGRYDYLEPPQALRQALTDARYPEIEELFRLQRKWIDRVR